MKRTRTLPGQKKIKKVAVKRFLCPERIPAYQEGGEGFVKFVEENVRVSIPKEGSVVPRWVLMGNLPDTPDPETGKSFKQLWENEKEVLKDALQQKPNGDFKYRLIVLCWMRGEGKSFVVCLIQAWKFFCFPRQLIVLGANSKEQTKFVHYDIIRDIILNSPNLIRVIGKKNIQEKMISLRNQRGEVMSSIRSISSFSGIVSNITGYTFSEMFDMKDPKFFVQLDGSTRNTAGALGTIDSTVAVKGHILSDLHDASKEGTDKTLFFSHRESPDADYRDFWHPKMNKDQLVSYGRRFPPAMFDQYFKNTWESASGRLFAPNMIEAINYIGADGLLGNEEDVQDLCLEKFEIITKSDAKSRQKNRRAKHRSKNIKQRQAKERKRKLAIIASRLISIDEIYQLNDGVVPKMATANDLDRLTEIYDTDWAIIAGLDRSDPLSKEPYARTINTVVAKGLVGSKSKRLQPQDFDMDSNIPYIYVLIKLDFIEDASLEGIKTSYNEAYDEFDGIDTLCSERWGAWDLAPWCEERNITFEAVFPSYEKQKQCFNYTWFAISSGQFKAPEVYVPGARETDILREELTLFDYYPVKRWYGSPEKNKKKGIQDDAIFSLGWCLYGGRNLTMEHLRVRRSDSVFGFGQMFQNKLNLQPPTSTFICGS